MKHPIVALTFLIASQATAEVFTYRVQKGETLSTILYDKLGCQPVYGKNGLIKKVVEMNPFLRQKTGNHVRAGDVLRLNCNCSHADQQFVKEVVTVKEVTPPSRQLSHAILKDHSIEYTYFKMVPHVFWFTVDANYHDQYRVSSLSTVTAASPGLSAEYGLGLGAGSTGELTFFTHIEATQLNFYSDPTITIERLHLIKKTISAGGTYGPFSLTLGFSDKIFLLAPDVTTVRIETAQVPEIKLGYNNTLWQKKNFSLSTGTQLKAFLPRKSGVVETNASLGAEAFVSVKLKNKGVRLFYLYEENRSNVSDTTFSGFGMGLSFETSFLEN